MVAQVGHFYFEAVGQFLHRRQRQAERARELAMAMDFGCLYDGQRPVFHVGLRVQEQALDASYYDLLASGSRLTSLLASAKGDVPRRHWSALGRPFLSVGAAAGLKSWSGSMFEYLMPSLLLPEPVGGLLHSAACAAAALAEEQLRYTIGIARKAAVAGQDPDPVLVAARVRAIATNFTAVKST